MEEDIDIQKFFNKAKRASLSSLEREEMRGDLEQFMSEHPVRKARASRLLGQGGSKFNIPAFMEIFSLKPLIHNLQPMTIALIIALLIGGGTSFAAEGSLPGDILYPIKVNINEEIRGAVAFSDTAQADWDARRAGRRLEEAEELAVEGGLNAETRADIEARFKTHAEAFRERAERIGEKQTPRDSFEVHSNFEVSLQAHENILARLAMKSVEIETHIRPILQDVRARLVVAQGARANAEVKILEDTGVQVEAAAKGKLQAAENKIRETRSFLEQKKLSAGADVSAQAGARLDRAEALVARGKDEFEAETYGKAFVSFQEAIRMSQEAKLLLETESRINLEVKAPGLNVNVGSDDGAETETETRPEDEQSSGSGASIEIESKTDVEAGGGSTGVEGDGRIKIDVGL